MALFVPNPPVCNAGDGTPCAVGSACHVRARSYFAVPLLLAAVLGAFGGAGCDRAPAEQSGSRRGATVQVVNVSDHEWVLALRRANDREARQAKLGPRAQATVVLPGGDYLVEQTAVGGELAAAPPRRFTARLEAGQVYRWPVTTLLSADPGPGESRGAAPTHE